MAAQSRPEVSVKIGANTSGLTAGFDEAVRTTEQGVAQMKSAIAKLETTQISAAMWTRNRAAAEREAYAMSERLAATTQRTTRALTLVSSATEVSAARFAQAAQKSIVLTDALARGTLSGGSMAAKFIGVGSTAGMIFGPAGAATVAIAGFGALVASTMSGVKEELSEVEAKFKETVEALINAGDVAKLKQMAQDIFVGTPAKGFEDGIAGIKRRLAELGPLENIPVLGKGNVEKRQEIERLTVELARLEAQFLKLQQAAMDSVNVPKVFTGLDEVKITATSPETTRRKQRELEEARREIAVEREVAIAAEGRRITELMTAEERRRAEIAEEIALERAIRIAEDDRLFRERQAEAAAAYQTTWEQAIDRVTTAFGQSFRGIFDGTKTVADAFRDMGRMILENAVANIGRSLSIWIAAELTKRAMGQATAKQTVANSAVEAAARAWAAVVGIPFIGPVLAPLAAAGAFAGVLAFGSGIASAAGGWDRVPSDQVAMVHRNEMVLPAPLAEGVRQMAEQGGPSGSPVNFTVVAQDSQSFVQFLSRNAGGLAEVITEAVRNGRLHLEPG